jgi:hypothetical protein
MVLCFFPGKSFNTMKPTRNITSVPITMVRLLWNGLLNASKLPSVKYSGDKLIQIITRAPTITPTAASIFLTLFDRNASRKQTEHSAAENRSQRPPCIQNTFNTNQRKGDDNTKRAKND